MKILLKKKDGTTLEISAEEARSLLKNKKANLDPLNCRCERVKEGDKEVLNIFAPNLGKLGLLKEPNK